MPGKHHAKSDRHDEKDQQNEESDSSIAHVTLIWFYIEPLPPTTGLSQLYGSC
jgi:hypothetical protein